MRTQTHSGLQISLSLWSYPSLCTAPKTLRHSSPQGIGGEVNFQWAEVWERSVKLLFCCHSLAQQALLLAVDVWACYCLCLEQRSTRVSRNLTFHIFTATVCWRLKRVTFTASCWYSFRICCHLNVTSTIYHITESAVFAHLKSINVVMNKSFVCVRDLHTEANHQQYKYG